jgi:acyl-CoA reductase-like NAD-dependent aldehyde dehydrogenase
MQIFLIAIARSSTNIELAKSGILWNLVVNTGQSCLSIERIYVTESIFEAFVDRLVTEAKGLKSIRSRKNSIAATIFSSFNLSLRRV